MDENKTPMPAPHRSGPSRAGDIEAAYVRLMEQRIDAWREQPPPLVARLSERASGRAGRLARKLIPSRLLARVFGVLDGAAERFADRDGVLAKAGVATLGELANGPLQRCDRLADSVIQRATLLAGGGGAVFGFAGAVGLVVELPALLLQSLRMVRRVGACFGEDCNAELALAVLAAASAGSVAEKQLALAEIDAIGQVGGLGDAGRASLERATERQLAKRAATAGLESLARRTGARIAAGGLPGVGAIVGAGLSAYYLTEVAEAARFTFARRWLARQTPPKRKRRPGRAARPADSATRAAARRAGPEPSADR
jgi:hypothetical protein